MRNVDIERAFRLYLRERPSLAPAELGVLLLIDDLYRHQPDDLEAFRATYRHLDPAIIDHSAEGITFLTLAASDAPPEELKERLNHYINIKLNPVNRYSNYEENMVRFRRLARAVSDTIDGILALAGLPEEMAAVIAECSAVRHCVDFYSLLEVYRATTSPRIRFEILRKIGLIVLLTRISRHYIEDDLAAAVDGVKDAFRTNLGLRATGQCLTYYYWVNCDSQVTFGTDKATCAEQFAADQEQRKLKQLPLPTAELQRFDCLPCVTDSGIEILHFQSRNKLRRAGAGTYVSVVEKIARKNLQYPKDLHDIIGAKLVVRHEEMIPHLVRDLERFLGGSSTRKEEKNSLHKFGRRKLSEFSSDQYSVWKAIYDIALPHPSITHVQHMMAMTRDNDQAQFQLRQRLAYFEDRPKDWVVEVQLQDLPSFLLGVARGSPAQHSVLKANQVRLNSFYKIFPREIYEPELQVIKDRILQPQRRKGPPGWSTACRSSRTGTDG
jgi:hypothetical protein